MSQTKCPNCGGHLICDADIERGAHIHDVHTADREIERLRARVAVLESERDEAWAALIEPWPECLGEEGRQELLASLGLIAPQTVTEHMRDTCGGECWCEVGDDCYRLTAAGETALRTTAKRAALRGEEG